MSANIEKKIPTARQVSATLRAAGFSASRSLTTRIRGWRNHTAGFSTGTYMPVNDCVVVSHVSGDSTSADGRVWLDRYESALRVKYTVERGDGRLVVTGFAG